MSTVVAPSPQRRRGPDTRERRPKPGRRHLLLRDVPETTLAQVERVGAEHGQSASAYIITMLNRWAERQERQAQQSQGQAK